MYSGDAKERKGEKAKKEEINKYLKVCSAVLLCVKRLLKIYRETFYCPAPAAGWSAI